MFDLRSEPAAGIEFVAIAEDRQQPRRHRTEWTIETNQPRWNPVRLQSAMQAFRGTTVVMAVTEETPVAEVAIHEPSPRMRKLLSFVQRGNAAWAASPGNRPGGSGHQTRSSGTWYCGSA